MAQQALALELYDMINDLTFLSDNLIEVRGQALARVDTLPEGAEAALSGDLEAYAAALEELRTSLSVTQGGMIAGKQKLRERLGTLYGNVTSYDGRPSSTQFARRDSLGDELAEAMVASEPLLNERLAAINARLGEAGLDALTVLDRDAWNEQEGVASFTTAVFNQRALRALMPQALWGLER
jgi:hypothetical protein